MKTKKNLVPKNLWRRAYALYKEMSKIPRGSGNTEAIKEWLISFAKNHRLEYKTYKGNMMIYGRGWNGSAKIALQGHMDMVNAYDTSVYEMMPPITLQKTKGWCHGKGTSIGADNGLGLAFGLAILTSRKARILPIAVLATRDEETGMFGAKEVAKETDWLDEEVTYFINLDSEDLGTIYNGCAGGRKITWSLPVSRSTAVGSMLNIKLTGLKGGHSGVNIGDSYNAIHLLGETLSGAYHSQPFWLRDIRGGQFNVEGGPVVNVIPKDASATVVVDTDKLDGFMSTLEMLRATLVNKYGGMEPNIDLSFELVSPDDAVDMNCITMDRSRSIIDHLSNAPTGLQRMFENGQVKTSLNLSNIQTTEDSVILNFSIRSSENCEMEALVKKLLSVGDGDFSEDANFSFPAWEPKEASELADKAKTVFERMFGYAPKVETIHGGLEVAIFFSQHPEIEYISVGPTILYVHTDKERFCISDAVKFAKFLWYFVFELTTAA